MLNFRKPSQKKATATKTVRGLETTMWSYLALVPTYGFEIEQHCAEKKKTDGIWKYFLAGILKEGGQERQQSPAFGSSTMMNGVIESIINSHNNLKKTNRINVVPSLLLVHLASRMENILVQLDSKAFGPQQDGKLKILRNLQLKTSNCAERHQLNGVDFELDAEKIAIIKALLAARIKDRQTSFLADIEHELHHFICPEDILASSFIRHQSLQAMPSDLLQGLQRGKRLNNFSLENQLRTLRYDLLDSVANLFPFARHGDVIVYIVGDPLIQGHFFVVAILKTTDGVAGAVFDSYVMEHNLRLKKESPFPVSFQHDVLGLLQFFLTLNSHVLLAEYSIEEKSKIIENFVLYTPKEYRQPSLSNVCWLYSVAIIQEFSSQSSELICIGDVNSAHEFFEKVASSVASKFSDHNAFKSWVKTLKEEHWDAHITPSEDSKDTWVGPIRLKEYLKPNKWDLETGIHLEEIRKYEKVWVLLEAPTPLGKKLGPIRQPVGRQSFEVVNRAWGSCHKNRLETLGGMVANAKAEAKVSNHASNLSNFTKMLTSFEEVLTDRALHTQASIFLSDPVAQLTNGNFAFLHGEQEWPHYNKGEGGADLIFSPNASTKRVSASSTFECHVPKQVVIFHAATQRSFHAGSAPNGKHSVNVAKSNNFCFCANPNNRFFKHYDSMVPLYAWPTASQMRLGSDDVRRPDIGGQGKNVGETVTVEVQNWKDVSGTAGKKSLLTRLNQSLKRDKQVRNDLVFKNILDTLKKLIGSVEKFLPETKAVNILPIPGDGDCFPQACTLSIMLSADPAHGALLYNTLFPQTLRFTQLHRYVFKDNLCGCARFWFARWCCQKQDVRAILEQSLRQSVFAQDLEGNGLSRRMKIADFLNLIARNSDQIEAGMSHFFYTKLMHYFVEFLQEVLSINITLLILTSGKDNTLFLQEGSTRELTSDHFLVLVREGGQNTSSSHYRPLLLDYQLERVWQSCGLLKYKDLPKFVIALLERHQNPAVQEILHNVGDWNDPAPTHRLLFSEDRLSKNLFLWRVALMVNNGQHTKELGKTVICGPLYSLGLLGPYLKCERRDMCMQMFQGDMTTAGHNKNCVEFVGQLYAEL